MMSNPGDDGLVDQRDNVNHSLIRQNKNRTDCYDRSQAAEKFLFWEVSNGDLKIRI